jgi:hypothetical protein
MNPVIEKERPCECGGTIQRFGNVTRCSQCGRQDGVARYQGEGCPNGCTAVVVSIPGAGRRCQQCSAQW